jgi:hypothetical protein
VGSSNSPFTATPNNFISDPAAYNIAYPSDESTPRDDYLVLVTSEVAPSLSPGFGGLPASGPAGLLVNAGFGYTKNEVVNRLDYDTHGGRFRTLPGGSLAVLGVLGPTSNTTRLKAVPIPLQFLAAAPYRLSLGTSGSGTTQTVSLVPNDGAFGSPPAGTTELSLATGNLNWNTVDLSSYAGQTVRWQQQQYFALTASNGNIGTLAVGTNILLNPIPGHGQFPLIRFGYLFWLQTVEVASELAFTTPPPGTVQWALTTGALNFNPIDITHNLGTSVYYDGTLFARDLTLPRQSIGTINAPTPITLPSPATGDIIFALPTSSPYYQFPQYSLVAAFTSPGTQGTVQVNQISGAVQFSTADVAKFTGHTVEVVYGDLPIDHGISIRFFRSPVDLDAQTVGVKDVTALYSVTNAVWASPIMGSPFVFLPSTPVNDNTLVVSVGQGTGSFVGPLNALQGPSPPVGLGYTINFDSNQIAFAQRKNNVFVLLQVEQGFVQLPDPLVEVANIVLGLETGPSTGIFIPITPGIDCVVDPIPGLVYFTSTFGVELTNGPAGAFIALVFTDPTANFLGSGVAPGDYLLVEAPYAMGVYTIVGVGGGGGPYGGGPFGGGPFGGGGSTTLTTDVPPPPGSGILPYEILSGKEIMADRFFMPVTLTDPITSVELLRSLGTIVNSTTIVASSTASFLDLNTLGDASVNFITDGVLPGDTINIPALTLPAQPAQWRLVLTNTALTLTPSASFISVRANTYSVTRRLQIPTNLIGRVRFRYGSPTPLNPIGVFSTTVNVVSNDGLFSSPSSLAQGTVEVSQATGNLNFASVDVAAGGIVFVSEKLAANADYQTQPQLGLIQFTSRLLTNEEVLLTYVQEPPSTTPPTSPVIFKDERGTFLVRKELARPHPTPTSTLFFNPTGKSVALDPSPRVFRGGRVQVTNTQVTINPGNPPSAPSSMTFLPDNILTDALPHGAIVGPTENVYIDYFIYQAMGGEQTVTVLNPPLRVATVNIVDGATSFTIASDQTPNFPSGFLMTVNGNEVYQIGAVTYDFGLNQTTVNLGDTVVVANVSNNVGVVQITSSVPHGFVSGQSASVAGVLGVPGANGGPFLVTVIDSLNFLLNGTIFTGAYGGGGVVTTGSQLFQSDQTNPPLQIASGPTPLVTVSLFLPSYFVQELNPYPQVPRGANTIVIPGNRTSNYRTNTVVYVTDNIGSFTDFYLVTASAYDGVSDTTVTLASNVLRQYTFGQQFISYSVRPVFGQPPTVVHTAFPPLSTQPITVIRRVAGQIGRILSSPIDFKMDDSGTVTYASPLQPNEEFSIFYTAYRTAAAGLRVEASYTCSITPNTTNGLLGQVLNANYTIFSPDNFYYRVETLTVFKSQMIQQIQEQAQSSSPSSGPMTSNTSTPQLFNQGRPSVYYNEGDYANQDLVARDCLKFFNDAINALEDALQAMDGRVVGDASGRFKFDGNINNPVRSSFSAVTNQIDDLLLVSPFPLPNGTVQQVWVQGPFSRFYKSRRNIFTSSPAVVSGGTKSGDVIAKYDFQKLSSLPAITFKRWPRAQVQFPYSAGTQTFTVDNANGTNDSLQRPSFQNNMRVVIEDALGTVYLNSAANVTVTSFTPTTITLSAPVAASIPAGATIFMSPSDADSRMVSGQGGYQMFYQFGKDLNADLLTGELLYVPTPAIVFPLFGPIVNPVQNGDILEADAAGVSVTYTAPYKFPALFGGTSDDDGNQAVPIVGPLFTGEITPSGGGALYDEQAILTAWTTTAPPILGTGSLNLAGTVITTAALAFAPKQHDLIRILTGVNAGSIYHHVGPGATTTTIPLVEAFTTDAGFQFALVTTSASVVLGLTGNVTGTAFTDASSPFILAMVGDTLVVTSGLNAGLRRQILSFVSGTSVTLDTAFPSNDTFFSYRIDNTLNTYTGVSLTQLQTDVATELASVGNEDTSILSFFNQIFNPPVVTSSTGNVTATLMTLGDPTPDFVMAGVTNNDFVWVTTGPNTGVYQIASITDAHDLVTQQPFGSTTASLAYVIVSAFGCGYPTMQALYTILTANTTFVSSTTTWASLIAATTVAVVGDSGAYANSLLVQMSDITSRQSVVSGRISYLTNAGTGPIAIIEASLNSSDQLYNKRYVWIDARIDLQTGLLVLEQTAVAQRIAQQAQLFNQLIKLLSVEGS